MYNLHLKNLLNWKLTLDKFDFEKFSVLMARFNPVFMTREIVDKYIF